MTTTDSTMRSPEQKVSFWSYLRHKDIDYYPDRKLRGWLLALVTLAFTVQNFELFKAGPVLPYIFTDLHTNLTVWGYLSAAAGGATAVGGLVAGFVADRAGRRPVIVWPIALYGIVMVVGALAPNLGVFALTIFLGALLSAGMSPAVTGAARDLSPQSSRAGSFSWIGAAYTLGALLSTWVAFITIPIWPGFRPQYWIGAIFSLFTLIVLFVFYRDLSPRIRGQILRNQADALNVRVHELGFVSTEEAMKSGNLIWRSWRLWVLNCVAIFWGIAYVTVGAYVPLYIVQFDHIGEASSAGLASMFWVTFSVSLVFSGWLCDRLRTRKLIGMFGGIATGAMFFIIAVLPKTHSIAELSTIWALTGVTAGFIFPAFTALVSENAEAISPFGVGRAFSQWMILSLAQTLFVNLWLPHVVGDGSGWPTWMVIAGISSILVAVCIAVGAVSPWLPLPRAKEKVPAEVASDGP